MDAQDEQIIDHINGDGLDNRRDNLRIATYGQNTQNSDATSISGYKGVIADANRWKAYIHFEGKRIYLGSYVVKEEAASAYNEAALFYFGTNARINTYG